MKRRFLAVMASMMLVFSAGMPMNTAKADDYGAIVDASEDYQGMNENNETDTLSYAETADTGSSGSAKTILICIVIGCVIGGVITLAKVSSMKSVRKQFGAADYKKPNSFKLDINTDSYLYNRIEKTPLPQQTSNNNNAGRSQ